MNSKIVPIIIGVVVLVGVGGLIVFQMQPSQSSDQSQTSVTDTGATQVPTDQGTSAGTTGTTNTVQGSQPGATTGTTGGAAGTTATKPAAGTYSAAQVATHKDSSSCWSSIDGTVYDLTKWISQHPGGPQAIEGLCGHDGSTAFHNKHDHKAQQESILATMKIGTLTN